MRKLPVSAHEKATSIISLLTCIVFVFECVFIFRILNFIRVFRSFFIAHFAGIKPLYLKIATIHCRGFRNPAKCLALFAYARKLDVQVLCLQETYSQPQDEQKWQNEWGGQKSSCFQLEH